MKIPTSCCSSVITSTTLLKRINRPCAATASACSTTPLRPHDRRAVRDQGEQLFRHRADRVLTMSLTSFIDWFIPEALRRETETCGRDILERPLLGLVLVA